MHNAEAFNDYVTCHLGNIFSIGINKSLCYVSSAMSFLSNHFLPQNPYPHPNSISLNTQK